MLLILSSDSRGFFSVSHSLAFFIFVSKQTALLSEANLRTMSLCSNFATYQDKVVGILSS